MLGFGLPQPWSLWSEPERGRLRAVALAEDVATRLCETSVPDDAGLPLPGRKGSRDTASWSEGLICVALGSL